MLQDWLSLNKEIREAFKQKTTYWVQPGYIGKSFKGLLLVAVRPGAPKGWNADTNQSMQQAGDEIEFNRSYKKMLETHPLIRKYVEKIMAPNELTWDDIGWINIVKFANENNEEPTQAEIDESMPFTLKQIELANPRVIVCVGKTPYTLLKNLGLQAKLVHSNHYAFMARIGLLEKGAADVGIAVKTVLNTSTLDKWMKA